MLAIEFRMPPSPTIADPHHRHPTIPLNPSIVFDAHGSRSSRRTSNTHRPRRTTIRVCSHRVPRTSFSNQRCPCSAHSYPLPHPMLFYPGPVPSSSASRSGLLQLFSPLAAMVDYAYKTLQSSPRVNPTCTSCVLRLRSSSSVHASVRPCSPPTHPPSVHRPSALPSFGPR